MAAPRSPALTPRCANTGILLRSKALRSPLPPERLSRAELRPLIGEVRPFLLPNGSRIAPSEPLLVHIAGGICHRPISAAPALPAARPLPSLHALALGPRCARAPGAALPELLAPELTEKIWERDWSLNLKLYGQRQMQASFFSLLFARAALHRGQRAELRPGSGAPGAAPWGRGALGAAAPIAGGAGWDRRC